MNHVQSVYISDIPPAGVRRFMEIYPSGLRPSRYIPINLLHSRWYITGIHLLAMIYILHIHSYMEEVRLEPLLQAIVIIVLANYPLRSSLETTEYFKVHRFYELYVRTSFPSVPAGPFWPS